MTCPLFPCLSMSMGSGRKGLFLLLTAGAGVQQPLAKAIAGVDQHGRHGDQHDVAARDEIQGGVEQQGDKPGIPLFGVAEQEQNAVGNAAGAGQGVQEGVFGPGDHLDQLAYHKAKDQNAGDHQNILFPAQALDHGQFLLDFVGVALPAQEADDVDGNPEGHSDDGDGVPAQGHTQHKLGDLDEKQVHHKIQFALFGDQKLTHRIGQDGDHRTDHHKGIGHILQHHIGQEDGKADGQQQYHSEVADLVRGKAFEKCFELG